MAKLSTQFMGMEPEESCSGCARPWTGTAEGLQAAIDAGAGAVMTETISQEVYPRLPQTCYHEGGAVFSTSLYSNLTLEQWEVEPGKAAPRGLQGDRFDKRGDAQRAWPMWPGRRNAWGWMPCSWTCTHPLGRCWRSLYTSPDLIAEPDLGGEK